MRFARNSRAPGLFDADDDPPAHGRALLVAFSLALLAPAGAAASSRQLSVMQDDARILHGSPQTREETLNEMDALGDRRGQGAAHLARRGARLAARRSEQSRPLYGWGLVDAAVAGIRARGMRPYLTIGGRAPNYAVGRQNRALQRHLPAERPEGSSSSPGRPGAATPGSSNIWSIWNEPGLTTWIQPQRDSRRRPLSPSIYRSLYLAGHRGLSDIRPRRLTRSCSASWPRSARGARNKVGPVEFIRE